MRDSTFRSLTLHLDAARAHLKDAFDHRTKRDDEGLGMALEAVSGRLELLETLLRPLPPAGDGNLAVTQARMYREAAEALHNAKLAEPGSVISGTHIAADIIEACMKFLGNGQRLTFDESQALFLAWARCGLDDEKLNEFLCDTIWPIMELFAPEGHYFGAYEGDGSDFGYWPVLDDDEQRMDPPPGEAAVGHAETRPDAPPLTEEEHHELFK